MCFKWFRNNHNQYHLIEEIRQLREELMATKQEVLDAVAEEKAQVLVGIEDLNKQIQDLKDQIAAGTPVTAADLDEIVSAVHDIFIPA
jgi:hypothetical protein